MKTLLTQLQQPSLQTFRQKSFAIQKGRWLTCLSCMCWNWNYHPDLIHVVTIIPPVVCSRRSAVGLRGRRRRHQTTRIPSSVDDSPAEIFSINDSVSSVQSQCRGAWHSGGPAHEKHTHAPCRTPPHTAQGEGLSGCAHVITCLDCTPGTAEHRTTSTTPPQHLHGA